MRQGSSGGIWKRMVLILGAVFVFIGVACVLFYVGINGWGAYQWGKYAQKTGALTWHEEWNPPPPKDEAKNFANSPLMGEYLKIIREHGVKNSKELESIKTELKDRMARWTPVWCDGVKLKRGQEPSMRKMRRTDPCPQLGHLPRKKNTKPDAFAYAEASQKIEKLFKPSDVVFQEIQQMLLDYPECAYGDKYEAVFDCFSPQFELIKNILSYSYKRMDAQLCVGDGENALKSIFFVLDLVKTFENEPKDSAFLLASNGYVSVVDEIWEGIESNAWTESQLQALQERLTGIRLWGGFKKWLAIERYSMNRVFLESSNMDGFYFDLCYLDEVNPTMMFLYKYIPRGYHYLALLEYNRLMDELSASMRDDEEMFDPIAFKKVCDKIQVFFIAGKIGVS